jgi:hypothetical protein
MHECVYKVDIQGPLNFGIEHGKPIAAFFLEFWWHCGWVEIFGEAAIM